MRAIVALLLPVLLYRALIPMGFMPMSGENGTFQMGLCPGTIDAATFIAAAANPHTQHHHQDGTSSSEGLAHSHHSTPCPYALSGAAPLTVAPYASLPVVYIDDKPLFDAAKAVFSPTILRVQSPRAPPTFA